MLNNSQIWLSVLTEFAIGNNTFVRESDGFWRKIIMEATRALGVRRLKVKRDDVEEIETLNFKVTREFKRQFKGYAVSQSVTMIELLREGFELTKQKRG